MALREPRNRLPCKADCRSRGILDSLESLSSKRLVSYKVRGGDCAVAPRTLDLAAFHCSCWVNVNQKGFKSLDKPVKWLYVRTYSGYSGYMPGSLRQAFAKGLTDGKPRPRSEKPGRSRHLPSACTPPGDHDHASHSINP